MTNLTTVRQPAVAGLFYPAEPDPLRRQVLQYLDNATTAGLRPPKAIISPHAGYPYSGPVAGSSYAPLRDLSHTIRRVILLGPSHRLGFSGIAAPSQAAFATPLGEIAVDRAALATIADIPGMQTLDAAHGQEHGLEVHLPFLQLLFDDVQVVPLVVGDSEAEPIATLLDRLWGGPETLIVISSDLSHFHDYATAQTRDQATTTAILDLDGDRIGFGDACGRNPLRGLLHSARQRAMKAELWDLRNSADTAGNRDRVVGYGAYGLFDD